MTETEFHARARRAAIHKARENPQGWLLPRRTICDAHRRGHNNHFQTSLTEQEKADI